MIVPVDLESIMNRHFVAVLARLLPVCILLNRLLPTAGSFRCSFPERYTPIHLLVASISFSAREIRNREPDQAGSLLSSSFHLMSRTGLPAKHWKFLTAQKECLGIRGPLAEMNLCRIPGSGCCPVSIPGNAQSEPGPAMATAKSQSSKQTGKQEKLVINSVVPGKRFRDTRWSRLLAVKSELLSGFYGRDVLQNAAVVLPASLLRAAGPALSGDLHDPGFWRGPLPGCLR